MRSLVLLKVDQQYKHVREYKLSHIGVVGFSNKFVAATK